MFISSSELITLLSSVLASFIHPQPIVVARHTAHIFLYFSVYMKQLFLAAANFSCCCFFLNPQQTALMFRVKWHALDVRLHASPHRGELLCWDCSGVVILTALNFFGGCGGGESYLPICKIVWVRLVSNVVLGFCLWFSSVWYVPGYRWFCWTSEYPDLVTYS